MKLQLYFLIAIGHTKIILEVSGKNPQKTWRFIELFRSNLATAREGPPNDRLNVELFEF